MKNNYSKRVRLSLVTAILLTSGAHAAEILGANLADSPVVELNTQYGFGGLNLENVNVNMVTGKDNEPIVDLFDPATGEYPQMALGDSYESSVFGISDDKSDPATRLGYVVQKVWPISEPMGIKVITNDLLTSNGKPQNCIMASSYQRYQDMANDASGSGFLDTTEVAGPKPVICSSDASTSKRLQLILNENVVANANAGEFGESVDLVFNIDPATVSEVDNTDLSFDGHRYQVFQKVSNFTGKRLDGFILEVLNSAGVPDDNLTLSLGIGENTSANAVDLFPSYEMAFYPPGLWGDGSKDHLPTGWFDSNASGYEVTGQGTNILTSGASTGGNYGVLFGDWQPDKWVPLGMHIVIDPLEEPALIAYWGTTPDQNFTTDTPAWHYGMYDNESNLTNFASPSPEELAAWAADMKTESNPDGLYVIDDIEDIPNVSLNYIVNVGVGIDNNFTIRIRPRVAADQTPPSYISKVDNETYIVPSQWVKPTADAGLDKTVQVNETVTITGTGTEGAGAIVSYEWKFGTEIVADTASFDFTPDTVGGATLTLTVTDNNGQKDDDSMNLIVTAVPVVDPVVDPVVEPVVSSGGGGGCTYNPNSKNFDMTFLLMMGLGLLYPFRRRFLK